MHRKLISVLVSGAVASITGCSTVSESQDNIKKDYANWNKKIENVVVKEQKYTAPSTVEKVNAPYAFAQKIKFAPSNEWLRAKVISINMTGKSMSLNAIIQDLSSQGLNVSSALPINSYYYTGYSITNATAEDALKSILENIGLDYSTDETSKTVVIKPMSTKTWKFNVGNRQASFNTGKVNTVNPLTSSTGATGGSTGSTGTSSAQSSSGGSLPSVSNTTANDGETGIASSDNFWGSLKEELESRLIKLVPNGKALNSTGGGVGTPSAAMSAAIPASGGGSSTELFNDYSKKKMGLATINSEVGTVTVQAPHWILEELDSHFAYINEMYSAKLTFEGQIILLNTDKADSEGLDIYKFAQYAQGKYGFTFASNTLGGVTLSPPSINTATGVVAPGTLNTVNPALGNVMMGAYASDFAIFNNYLSSFGHIDVLQSPIVSTSTGIPNTFSKTTPYFFNTTSETTSAGNAGAAQVAKTNTLNVVEVGTIFKVYPRYNPKTGLVSVQLVLNQNVLSGETEILQPTSSGTPNKVIIPIITKLKYEGEAMLRDGEISIIGGQKEDNVRTTGSGIAGTTDTAARGLFGTAKNQSTKGIYYFLLKVNVSKKY